MRGIIEIDISMHNCNDFFFLKGDIPHFVTKEFIKGKKYMIYFKRLN